MRFEQTLGYKRFQMVVLVVALTGCVKTKPMVVAPPSPPATPAVEKTFGEVTYGGLATLLIKYKDIVILIDPVFEPVGILGPSKAHLDTLRTPGQLQRTLPPALSFEALPPIDYLFLTDTQPHHLGSSAKSGLRKNLKILATNDAVAALQKSGFSQSKGLSQVQRIMLKKDEAFLFVTVVQARNPASEELVNGYLLEFDNGRNIFISGEIVDEGVMRQFVYDLRDDGKQIDLAFLYGGGLRTMRDKIWESGDENRCAVFAGLLQPKIAILLQTRGIDAALFDETTFQEKLKDQLYLGQALIPQPGDVIPF